VGKERERDVKRNLDVKVRNTGRKKGGEEGRRRPGLVVRSGGFENWKKSDKKILESLKDGFSLG